MNTQKSRHYPTRDRDIRSSRNMARRSSVTKKTALAVGAIACVLPGALAGSHVPQKFPQDCVKTAMLGKCLAGDKLFGDKPDREIMGAMAELLSKPLMSGPDDAPTLGVGFTDLVKKAAGKASDKVKKDAANAIKAAEKLKGDAKKAKNNFDAMKKAADKAKDALDKAKDALDKANASGDKKAVKKAQDAIKKAQSVVDSYKKKFKAAMDLAKKTGDKAQKAVDDAQKKSDAAGNDVTIDPPEPVDDADADADKGKDLKDKIKNMADKLSDKAKDMADKVADKKAMMQDKMSTMKAAFQGCDLSAIAQCMIDSDAPEAQAKGNEIKKMASSPMWKSTPAACSYPKASGGKPACEDFMKEEAKLAIGRNRAPRRAQLGSEQTQGQTGAAYVAVIASVAAFAGYTVYQRRQQYEPVPTHSYGAM